MIKNTLLFIISLQLYTTAIAQSLDISFGNGSNTTEIIKLNKIQKEVIYIFKNKNTNDSALTHTFYYDATGYPKEEILAKIKNYDESITKYSTSFTSEGKLRRQVVNKINLRMITINEYNYDTAGNEIKRYEYNEDTTELTIEQKIYNTKKQVIQLYTKINNNDFYLSRNYYYNQDGNISKTEALDVKGRIIYTYTYEYNKLENKKTIYSESDEGKKIEGEYFYNNDNLCTKIKTSTKAAVFVSQSNVEYEKFNQITENIYNEDKTLFETNVYLDGKKVQMTRHYYTKN